MRRVSGYWIVAVLFILIGLFLPRDWYEALPRRPDLPPPPLSGITLLQITFVLEGLIFISLALKRWTFARLRDVERLPIAAEISRSTVSLERTSFGWLVAITALGLFLRVLYLNSDLWLDEITPILDYGMMPAYQVIASYSSTNNHLLNTLLVNLAIALFGEQEAVIRLPAVVFGVATIPAIYWVSRLALSRQASLATALLLAVSYHHIFFSQNARGYTAYLFFSLLSSGLLIRGLQEDRLRIWLLYIVTMSLNFAALLASVFVFASHVLTCGVALLMLWRHGVSTAPLLRRLAAVFLVIGFLGLQLHALILPEAFVFVRVVYPNPATGYFPFSQEFLREMLRGVSAGFGPGAFVAALPFLVIAGAGFVILFRRHWVLTLTLAMPGLLTAFFLLATGLTFSPRFFLLALPVAILAAVQGIFSFSKLVARTLGKNGDTFPRRLAGALVTVISVISLASLRYYYSIPKQPYRASIQYLESQRKPGDIALVIHLAEKGYRYYGKRFGLVEGKDYFLVRSVEALDRVLSAHGETHSFLVTTFPRALHLLYPDLEARIVKGWAPARTFPATIGDGSISVWKPR